MKTRHSLYTILISLVAAFGGFLFGYDWVVIGGAKLFYEAYFDISDYPMMQGWVMGSAIIGCVVGVSVVGVFSDRFGRKPLMLFASIVFFLSSIGTGIVDSLDWLIGYRLLSGVAIGVASSVSPLYIAEVAPSKVRGTLVSINQLTIVLGILTAQSVNWLIADSVIEGQVFINSWNVQEGWRWMFWACGVPAAFYCLFLFFIPESPRWMAIHNQLDKAESVFVRIGGVNHAKLELQSIKNISKSSTNIVDLKYFFQPKVRKILITGVVLAIFQQWCGINIIFNYAQEIFMSAGYGVSDILFNIIITGITNVVFTFVGMYAVDRIGRRTLMIAGAAGLMLIYAILGSCYYFQIIGVIPLVLVIAAIACYAMTLAPVTWVILSEIFPNRIRGRAMAISTFALWVACFILTYTFPLLNSELGTYGTFWLYGLTCFLGLSFVYFRLPETKGKSLEEIEGSLTGYTGTKV